MKKYSGNFHIAVFIILSILYFFSSHKVYSQNDFTCPSGGHKGDESTITGRINFFTSTNPPESTYAAHGIVKLFKVNPLNADVIAVDSAVVNSLGWYAIFGVQPGDYYIVAYPDDPVEDYMVAFYPSGQLYTTASRINLAPGPGQFRTCNVKSIVMSQTTGQTPVYGEVADSLNHNSKLRNTIITAKSGNQFRGFAITDNQGKYLIKSLLPGTYTFTATRYGYKNQSQLVNVTSTPPTVNFYLQRDTASSIGISNNSSVVKNFKLNQNYPNPFNPSTEIVYSLEKGMEVRVALYTIEGKFVRDLVNEYKSAGEYRINFNAENLSTGVYSYVLETGEGQKESKFMVFTK